MHNRCFGDGKGKEFYAQYHDNEWGVPVHDDRLLFEMLILEGAQAGLSWETILKRREGYKKAFYNFDPEKVAKMHDQELELLLVDSGIVKNRSKVFATRQNVLIFLKIQDQYGSFNNYVCNFVDNQIIINLPKKLEDIPVTSKASDILAKDLKKRGMNFVGSTIIYAYMQAVGIANDHISDCFYQKIIN
jgi:DNA-3-methyladenine glycosylase I